MQKVEENKKQDNVRPKQPSEEKPAIDKKDAE